MPPRAAAQSGLDHFTTSERAIDRVINGHNRLEHLTHLGVVGASHPPNRLGSLRIECGTDKRDRSR